MSVVATTERRMETCMLALKEVSKVWAVAKMVHTLFESILGNKHLEERLQKAAGNRHKKRAPGPKTQPPSPPMKENSNKRKFDEVDAAFSGGQPAPQMSYERSRPQTPAITPSREAPPSLAQPMMHNHDTNEIPRQDAFMGHSRSGTRYHSPTTGAPGPSYPGTPPDLFLVTRTDPIIPEDLWANFQPDQLFPADTNLNFSPPANAAMIDPQLGGSQHPGMIPPQMQSPPGAMDGSMGGHHSQHSQYQQHNQQAHPGQQQMPQYQHQAHLQPNGQPMMQQHSPHSWAQVGAMNQRPSFGHEDTWSNSSVGAPVVPTTLNVEDWYVLLFLILFDCTDWISKRFNFFGMHGDMGQMHQAFAA